MNNGWSLMNPNYRAQNFDPRWLQSAPKTAILDIGYYTPPLLKDTDKKLPPTADVEASYQRGSTMIRQHNNSMIDDYYKKFAEFTLDFLAESPDGDPTVIYQDLDAQAKKAGTATAAKTTVKESTSNNLGSTQTEKTSKSTKESTTEEKKLKKKSSSKQEQPPTTATQSNSIQPVPQQNNAAPNAGTPQKAPAVVSNGQPAAIQQRQVIPPAAVPNRQPAAIQQRQALPNAQQIAIQQRPAAVPVAVPASNNIANDANAQKPMENQSNPVVFFDLVIDNDPRGRLVMELFRHVLPKTTQNFLSLCTHDRGYGYRLSYFHRIISGFMAQGGDFEKSNGTGGYSIYGEKFDDEGFPYKHHGSGLLSMANGGPNTNGSQFFVTLAPCPHLDNKHVVFGQVLQGFHILKDFEMSGSDDGEPIREVKIANAGQLN